MGRYVLEELITRAITDRVSGDVVTINADRADAFDADLLALCAEYHHNHDIVLAILFEQYKRHDRPDVFHTPD